MRALPGVEGHAFTQALSEGRASVEDAATLEDGWRNQRVLDAARRSHAERRWISLSSGT